MSGNGPKSTRSEVAVCALLALASTACAWLYLLDGGRGWVVGAVFATVLLIGVVAGIAER